MMTVMILTGRITVTWYADSDGDSYGNPSSSNICERANSTDVLNDDDCDDSDSGEKPGLRGMPTVMGSYEASSSIVRERIVQMC